MGILEVRDLSITLGGKRILDHLDIDFWEGHIHAIVGPNGAGKSTLASVIMGLSGYRDIEGDLLFKGRSIRDLPIDERGRLGITLAWQEPARFEGLKMRDFVMAPAKDRSEERFGELLELVGLDYDSYKDRAVDSTLSGGERKKVELASILAIDPCVVLLDEPDSGIDVASLERIFSALKILRENNATVILITHSVTVLDQAEHAFLMCDGKVVDKGVKDKIRRYFDEKCLPCDHVNRPECDGDQT